MTGPDLRREAESLRSRLSRLSEASLLISAALDFGVVFQEVIDNARSLTDARYGALQTLDQSGGIQDFITSGLSPEEFERLESPPVSWDCSGTSARYTSRREAGSIRCHRPAFRRKRARL